MNILKRICFAAIAVASLACAAPVFAQTPACCVGGNCCASGKCCSMDGCCKADKSCCNPAKGVCADTCGCPAMKCCSGSGAKTGTAAKVRSHAVGKVKTAK